MSAKLTVFFAPMNAGKSAQLQMKAFGYEERNIPYIILKSSIDTRDGNAVIHSRPMGDMKCIIIKPTEDLYKRISKELTNRGKLKYVLVDEAQFLKEKQVDQLSDVVDYLDINVICYGLKTDFKTKLFPGSKRLFEIADQVKEIESTCSCGEKNMFNARIDKNGRVLTTGAQVEVGGEDRYLTMCRKCYKEKTK
jgi:thymidine kinase